MGKIFSLNLTATLRTCMALVLPAALVSLLLLSGCSSSGSGGNSPPDPNPVPLSVTTSALPNAQVGSAYSATLTASGGKSPYTWTLTQGPLPAGLSLTPSSGVISGTPIGGPSGTKLTFQVKDASTPAQAKSVTLSLTVVSAVLKITTNSLPDGHVGSAYDALLSAGAASALHVGADERHAAGRSLTQHRQRCDLRHADRHQPGDPPDVAGDRQCHSGRAHEC